MISQYACRLHDRRQRHARRHLFLGIALIGLALLYLCGQIAGFAPLSAWSILPALLALAGTARLITARRGRQAVKGGFHLAVALWLLACIEQFHGLTFRSSWPVILILVGAYMLLRGLLPRERPVMESQP